MRYIGIQFLNLRSAVPYSSSIIIIHGNCQSATVSLIIVSNQIHAVITTLLAARPACTTIEVGTKSPNAVPPTQPGGDPETLALEVERCAK